MKQIVFLLLLLISFQSDSQADTMIVYYENGQLRAISPRLNGKANGESKMWYESGQLKSKGFWKDGKQIKTIMYNENGKKSYFTRYHKWKMKLKMWHSNGQLWTTSTSKYSRSIDKEFDSTGVLLRETIEKKGSALSCVIPIDSEPSDSATYKDGSCMCGWGNVYWRNGVFIDEKGRDLSSNYSSISTEFYSKGSKKKVTTWNNELKKHIVLEWDENGVLILESTY
jgi:antitoxin component YwqK of YwqJK toxin-antitoxin module